MGRSGGGSSRVTSVPLVCRTMPGPALRTGRTSAPGAADPRDAARIANPCCGLSPCQSPASTRVIAHLESHWRADSGRIAAGCRGSIRPSVRFHSVGQAADVEREGAVGQRGDLGMLLEARLQTPTAYQRDSSNAAARDATAPAPPTSRPRSGIAPRTTRRVRARLRRSMTWADFRAKIEVTAPELR